MVEAMPCWSGSELPEGLPSEFSDGKIRSLQYTEYMYSILDFHRPVALAPTPLLGPLLHNRVCAGFPSPAEDPWRPPD